jgi:hypothetical protein
MRVAQPCDGVSARRFAFSPWDKGRVMPSKTLVAERVLVLHHLAAADVQHDGLDASLPAR